MIIGDDTNKLYIDRLKIQNRTYSQISKPIIKSISGSIYIEDRKSDSLKALEIFNDNEFTYFRFNRNLASSRFPAIFQVIDKKLAQVDFSIVGDYLIAKTIADEWVFVEGSKKVFVRLKR